MIDVSQSTRDDSTAPMISRRQAWESWPALFLVFSLLFTIGSGITTLVLSRVREGDPQGSETMSRRLTDETTISTAQLFTPSSFTIVGPTIFPKPSDLLGEDARPNLQPTYGQHRPDADAVFVFAAEYGLDTYLCFVKSLRRTGFTGDIVFAVSILDISGRGVKEFLTTSEHVVTYVLELSCFNAENEVSTSAKGGMRVCQLHHLYADAHGNPQNDPRDARTIATTRYELYWLWSLHYKPHTWIMLIDARDSYFQTNPFDAVPRDTDPNKKSGVLHFSG
ncbi:hypothetical protein MHU86_14912 [Fragilaria crotonensis]|nr:hypothetical protein MHU86_14912 [Fragilaria crotonensis]